MAPERLKRNLPCLHLLSIASKNQRTALINNATRDQIRCICDCAQNFLDGNLPFTEQQINKLFRHRDTLHYLAKNKHTNGKEKRELIVQNGGFLPLLLTPILSLAGNLLADVISGRK